MSDKGLRAIQQALERGYYTEANELKVLDIELIEAMTIEIQKLERPEPKPEDKE